MITLFSTFITLMLGRPLFALEDEPSLARSRAYPGATRFKRGHPIIRNKSWE